jgi:DNA-directed RNA polymerase subunit RPC12/RpoP
MYRCWRCGKKVEIDSDKMGMKCPNCGCKIFYKERVTIAKKIRAR